MQYYWNASGSIQDQDYDKVLGHVTTSSPKIITYQRAHCIRILGREDSAREHMIACTWSVLIMLEYILAVRNWEHEASTMRSVELSNPLQMLLCTFRLSICLSFPCHTNRSGKRCPKAPASDHVGRAKQIIAKSLEFFFPLQQCWQRD